MYKKNPRSKWLRGFPYGYMTGVCFHAAYVRAVACVNFNSLAFVDEEGHAYCGARFYSGGFQCVGGGIALQARLCVGHLLLHLDGHVGIEHRVGRGIRHNIHHLAFQQEVHTVDEVVGNGDLVKSLLVHKLVVVAVMVEVLVGAAFHAHVFQLLADVEAALQHVSVHHVLQLGAHKRITLSRLYMQEVDAKVQLAIHADASSDFNVLGINHIRIILS